MNDPDESGISEKIAVQVVEGQCLEFFKFVSVVPLKCSSTKANVCLFTYLLFTFALKGLLRGFPFVIPYQTEFC